MATTGQVNIEMPNTTLSVATTPIVASNAAPAGQHVPAMTSAKSHSVSAFTVIILLVTLIVIVIVVTITVPVVLTKSSGSSSSNSNNAVNSVQSTHASVSSSSSSGSSLSSVLLSSAAVGASSFALSSNSAQTMPSQSMSSQSMAAPQTTMSSPGMPSFGNNTGNTAGGNTGSHATGGSNNSASGQVTASASSSTVGNTTSGVTYEIEVGPYEVVTDETAAYNKSNVTEFQAGIPIQYIITVMQGTTIMSGVRLDYWAANAQGLYSGESAENTAGTDYMRGWQIANSNGVITLISIFSGPYAGRTNHIHFRVRQYNATGGTTYDDTTQLFFPAVITAEIMTSVVAYERTQTSSWSTVNSNDRLYQVANEMTLTGNFTGATGFIATYTLQMPLTDCGDC